MRSASRKTISNKWETASRVQSCILSLPLTCVLSSGRPVEWKSFPSPGRRRWWLVSEKFSAPSLSLVVFFFLPRKWLWKNISSEKRLNAKLAISRRSLVVMTWVFRGKIVLNRATGTFNRWRESCSICLTNCTFAEFDRGSANLVDFLFAVFEWMHFLMQLTWGKVVQMNVI